MSTTNEPPSGLCPGPLFEFIAEAMADEERWRAIWVERGLSVVVIASAVGCFTGVALTSWVLGAVRGLRRPRGARS